MRSPPHSAPKSLFQVFVTHARFIKEWTQPHGSLFKHLCFPWHPGLAKLPDKVFQNKLQTQTNKQMEVERIAGLFFAVTPPATEAEIDALLQDLKIQGIENPVVPPFLKRIWERGAKWTRINNSYDCFGLNFLSPGDAVERVDDIFGDESNRQEWKENFGPNSAAAGAFLLFFFGGVLRDALAVDRSDLEAQMHANMHPRANMQTHTRTSTYTHACSQHVKPVSTPATHTTTHPSPQLFGSNKALTHTTAHMVVFGISSEYDYYFTSFDPASPVFNHVVSIVNNCFEESDPIPVKVFLEAVTTYTEVCVRECE